MRASSATVIGSAALVLVGCAAGIFLGRWIAVPSVEHETQAPPDSSAEIAELRRSIAEELQSLRQQLQVERVEPKEPGTREPAVAGRGDLDRLTAAVDRLNAILESNQPRAEPVARSRFIYNQAGKGLGYASIDAMWLRIQDKVVDADPAARAALDRELSIAHMLWSRDEVLNRYGGPSRLEGTPAKGVRLFYDSMATPGTSIGFETTDGLVVSVFYSAPRPNAQARR
ncbi:MAG TPA: hypothetical protein VGR31_13040 [Planctomycetota bacterium]|jgi:hypothetical protein|nr:hypothetical protein [Planctomycetota bacterium]